MIGHGVVQREGEEPSVLRLVENGGLGEANLADVLRLCKVLGITITEAAECVRG